MLPGVDDGPADVEAALALAREMVHAGVSTVVATSHVSHVYPNRPAGLAEARERLDEALRGAGIPLEVLPGAEIAVEQAALLSDDELRALTLGGGPYLLLEAPLSPTAADIEPVVHRLIDAGHRIILAHPERSPMFQRDPLRLMDLASRGVLSSITAGALVGRFGRTARRTARTMLAEDLVHDVASDAHDLAGRPPGLTEELAEAAGELAGLGENVAWLTREAPAAILAGEAPGTAPARVELPAAPEPRGGRIARLFSRR